MLRRTFLGVLGALSLVPLVRAVVGQPFEMAPFKSAQKAGKPILVVVYAEWCPTCRKQEPAIEGVLKAPEFSKFEVFKVEFDLQDDVLEAFNVKKQSTLLVFKGDKEVARSTGETRPEAISLMLRKAL